MAKITFSGIGITEMRGKLGTEIFSRNAQGAYVKSFVVPTNTITALRTAARDNFASAVSLWTLIDSAQLTTWQELQSRVFKSSKVAQRYRLTPRSVFISSNYNLLCSGQLPIMVADAFSKLEQIAKFSIVELTSTNFRLSVEFVGGSFIVPENHALVVSASNCVSAGIKSKKNGLVVVSVLDEFSDASDFNIVTDYSSIYSAPVVGKNVFLSFHLVNVINGLASVRHFGFSVVS